jgi:hypothetical protein
VVISLGQAGGGDAANHAHIRDPGRV